MGRKGKGRRTAYARRSRPQGVGKTKQQSAYFSQTAAAEKPMFLYVAYTAAHWPLHALPKDIRQYQGKYSEGWDTLRAARLASMKKLGIVPDSMTLSPRHPTVPAWNDAPHRDWQQRRMEVYAAQVTAMDRGIGEIIQALKKSGRFDRTLILFTIDNGGCHVEYTPNRRGDYLPAKTRDGRPVRPGNLPAIMPGPEDTYQSYGYGWANASNTPWRMFKQFDHEGGIRTPMIAHWPQGISDAGQQVPAVSHLIDIMPTVLDVTGTSVPEFPNGKKPVPMDGHSLAGAFEGQDIPGHETLFFHHARGRALRHGNWKIVTQGKNSAWELYNLASDPLELRNLAGAMPSRVKELGLIWESESERLRTQATTQQP